jgi:Ca-activated chloride channel homolog
MNFTWPTDLWFILVAPLLLGAYVIFQRRRHRYALRYANLSLVREALGRGPGVRRHVPAALFLLAIAALAFASARPTATVDVPRAEGTVVLAIDVSGSMLADDLKPTRLDAAKAAARQFVEQQGPDVQIGVVSLSSSAALVQAPTTDRDAVISAIGRLRPQSATAIGLGILAGLDAIFEDPEVTPPSVDALQQLRSGVVPTPGPFQPVLNDPATIVLLSDGQNNVPPPPLAIINAAISRGIRIYTVGIGTTAGTTVHIRGQTLHETLDETTLKQIAQLTDAQYFNAASASHLAAIMRNLKTQLVLVREKTEVTAVFTALAALLAATAGALSLLWFNRLP